MCRKIQRWLPARLKAFREQLTKDSIRCVVLLGYGRFHFVPRHDPTRCLKQKGDIEFRILDSTRSSADPYV